MLTIDVKHPDIKYFLKVKKVPNWVTNQIVEQCGWSGLFSDSELDTIKKQVMENTQVRFANISVKASDEFMNAVDEENKLLIINGSVPGRKNSVVFVNDSVKKN